MTEPAPTPESTHRVIVDGTTYVHIAEFEFLLEALETAMFFVPDHTPHPNDREKPDEIKDAWNRASDIIAEAQKRTPDYWVKHNEYRKAEIDPYGLVKLVRKMET